MNTWTAHIAQVGFSLLVEAAVSRYIVPHNKAALTTYIAASASPLR